MGLSHPRNRNRPAEQSHRSVRRPARGLKAPRHRSGAGRRRTVPPDDNPRPRADRPSSATAAYRRAQEDAVPSRLESRAVSLWKRGDFLSSRRYPMPAIAGRRDHRPLRRGNGAMQVAHPRLAPEDHKNRGRRSDGEGRAQGTSCGWRGFVRHLFTSSKRMWCAREGTIHRGQTIINFRAFRYQNTLVTTSL